MSTLRCSFIHGAVLVLIVAAIASCSPTGDADPLALRNQEPSEVVFLFQNATPDAVMQALFQGRVITDDRGCLRLESTDRHTVVWPKGFTLEGVGAELRVLDGTGTEVGQIGGSFSLGGGEVPFLHEGVPVSPADRQRAHESCPGRYWIVGDVLRP